MLRPPPAAHPVPGTTNPRRVCAPARVVRGVFLLLLLGGCRSAVEPAPHLSLKGTVVRADTGAPLPGARVGLLRSVDRGDWRDHVVAAEATADAQGRFSLSYPAAEGECASLALHATMDTWQNAGYSSEPARDLKCTSAVQRIDVRLTFEPF